MRPYSSYKDCGVEWIGEIPSDWGITKIKYETIVPVQYGINIGSEYYVDEGVRFIRTTDITDDGNLIGEGVYLHPNYVEDIYKTQLNDLLISRSGTLGRTYLHSVEDDMTYGGYLVRFNFGDKIKSKFIFYYTKTRNFEDWLSLNTIQSTIGNVNGQKYSNLSFPIPPLSEQKQIVSFLDSKTQKIDELIEKTGKKIELLKENRISLINHCVTKGLNPNVKMKDSGVEWIGEIPSHWDSIPIKYILEKNKDSIRTGPFGSQLKSDDMVSEGIKIYNQRTVYDEDFLKGEIYITPEKYETMKGFTVLNGDILISSRGTIGKMTIVPNGSEIGVLHPCLIRLRVDVGLISKRYLWWYMNHSSLFLESVKYESNSTTIDVIYSNVLTEIRFPLPPIKEQKQIVDYLDEQTKKIDSTIEKETQRIELLKEYRQSLISEVVTGKIDVRDWK
jgi:type I restriction enzyme S subunit